MEAKYKLCFVVSGLKGGGTEKLVTSLANYYVDNGHDVSLLLLFKNTEKFFIPDKRIKIVEPTLERNKINRFIYAYKLISFIRGSIKSLNPDVIVSHGEWFNSYVVFATLGINKPVYLQDHMNPDLDLGPLLNTSRKIFYRKASGIIALTQYALKRIMERTGAKNIKVIQNPLSIRTINPQPKEKSIVSLGRLSKEKGHRFLIEAFAGIVQDGWKLKVIGDGPEKENLISLARTLGVASKITFYGHISNFEEEVAKSEIFVLPSLSECFPIALIEAMALSVSCISSNCLAGDDIIIKNGVNGLIVSPGDVDELRIAINLLIQDEKLRQRLAHEAVKIKEELQMEKIAEQYLNFITEEL